MLNEEHSFVLLPNEISKEFTELDVWDSITNAVSAVIPVINSIPGLRMLLGVILVFFLPGFTWSLLLFKTVTVAERFALSIGLSIALVTLSILGMNIVFHIPVSGVWPLVIILTLVGSPLIVIWAPRYFRWWRANDRE